MKFETLYNGEKIPRLGLGTWAIGGESTPDTTRDSFYIDAIRTALELGYTLIDTAEMYGGGHTEELIGRAIKGNRREGLFITSKAWDTHLRYPDVVRACEASLKRLGMDYLDLYLIHWPNSRIPLQETFKGLNQLVEQGKTKYLGVSNFNLQLLKQAQELSGFPIATDQVPYNLQNREYAKNGVLDYCQKNNIILTAYQPIERGRLLNDRRLRSIAERYQATPAQIALAWLIHQPKVIAIPMSTSREHLKENLDALDIDLSAEDFEKLSES
jgi:diketogulonate reductase-like aldo/keto reductase